MADFIEDFGLIILMGSITLVIFVFLAIGSFKMESKTYNKLTGAETTWVDAAWVELRVQGSPR